MALGTTNITTTIAKNAISESTNAVRALCISSNIHEWSLHKPANYGTGNDTWTVDVNEDSGYVKPIGISSDTTGHRLGDFRGYNHTANPPRYFDGNVSYSYYKYEPPTGAVFVYKGEMYPTFNNSGFAPSFHELDFENIDNDTGCAIKLNIGAVDYGDLYEIKPATGDIGIALDKGAGTYTLKAYYWARGDETLSWTKSNEIEGGTVTLTVTELGPKFTIMSRSIAPSTVYTGTDHSIEDFVYSYSIRNNTTSQITITLYWHLGNKQGTINGITVAASATENKTINISQAAVYIPSEEFTLRYGSSIGDLIDNSNAIVTVEEV